jgi:uncharacterized protein (DUF58 family)
MMAKATLSLDLGAIAPNNTKDIAQYPFYRGRYLYRLIWRFLSHRFTAAGGLLIIPTFVLGLIGSSSLDWQTYAACDYALAFWLIAGVIALTYRPKLAITSRHAGRVTAGETLTIDIDAVNESRVTAVDFRIVPRALPPSIDAVPLGGAVLPPLRRRQAARAGLSLKCNHRGLFELRGFRTESAFPFGLLRAYRFVSCEQPLLVLPRYRPLDRVRLPAGRRYQPGGVALASEVGESFEFIGDREYREGDDMRTVDWLATARLSTLIVREYREEYFHRIAIILDAHCPVAAGPAAAKPFESAVSFAAALADRMSHGEYIIDLIAAGPEIYQISFGRSLGNIEQVLEILACIEATEEPAFARLAPQIAPLLERVTSVICIMLDWDDERRAFVEEIRRSGAGAKVAVIRDAHCTQDPLADSSESLVIRAWTSEEINNSVSEF